MESDMKLICEGKKTKQQVLTDGIKLYRDEFIKTSERIQKLKEVLFSIFSIFSIFLIFFHFKIINEIKFIFLYKVCFNIFYTWTKRFSPSTTKWKWKWKRKWWGWRWRRWKFKSR